MPYSLRGNPAKERFLREYPDTKCLEHTVLLAREPDECCCGRPLDGEYYLFSYGPEENRQQFLAGPNCGERLVEIGNLDVPDFFDLFIQDESVSAEQKLERSEHIRETHENIVELPENKEMRNAISLLFCLWEYRNREGVLSKIRKTLKENPLQNVGEKRINILNNAIRTTAINHYKKEMTLRQMFQEVVLTHSRRARTFSFQFLENRCREFGIQCYL